MADRTVVVRLRADIDQFKREMRDAANTTRDTRTEIEGIGRVSKSAASGMSSIAKSGRGMGRTKLILGLVAAGIAALGPLAALAAGAIGGIVGVVGTVALAWSSLNRQMEEGTVLGQQVGAAVDGVASSWAALGDVAAEAMSGGILASLAQLETRLPGFAGLVDEIGESLGNALNIGTDALLDGLTVAGPLLADAAAYAEEFAIWLNQAANSQEFADFIAYAQDTLPEVVDALVSFTQGLADLGQVLAPVGDALIDIIDGVGKLFSGLLAVDEIMRASSKGWGEFLTTLTMYVTGASDAKVATDELKTGFEQVAESATNLSPTLLAQAEELDENKDGFIDATEAAQGFADALRQLNQPTLDLRAAQREVQEALDDATQSIKDNGKNLDIHTAKGRNNQEALDDVAQALNDEIAALQEDGAAHGQLQGKLDTSRAKLEATARKFGMSAGEARAYADDVLGIPDTANTVVQFNASSAQGLIANYKASLASIPRNVHTSVTTSGGRRMGTGITFATGGFTGHGAKYEEAGTVHKGEFVNTKETTARHRGLLEWIHAGRDPKKYLGSYAGGGYVSRQFAAPSPAPRITVSAPSSSGDVVARLHPSDIKAIAASVGEAAYAGTSQQRRNEYIGAASTPRGRRR